jgi:hypothetical protein
MAAKYSKKPYKTVRFVRLFGFYTEGAITHTT